ncbi:PREDICTED: uncharacterized protein LOC106326501 [Brassica oleracea var. oleracea]|uniref:uncharacterized protein LOC106326501 n=1 Tax=Brassica oleracea var. oleracea TaxID=109376 RepID=UPI0006A7097B|nr:PREDICTED: uncharacterized protein LOC106326501 [Brassica oleracea var. oleracea]
MGKNFHGARTEVFWDVTDFPIRTTDRSYLETLRSVIGNYGYTGPLRLRAYGEKKPDNLGDGITFELIGEKFARLNKMLLDIGLWELDTTHLSLTLTNVLVIAENIDEDTSFVSVSRNLKSHARNCLWVLPDDYEDEKIYRVKLPSANFIWKWQDLLDGNEPMSKDKVSSMRCKTPCDRLG